MHGHNLERRGPWIADHAQDTILSLSDGDQPMFHPRIVFIGFSALWIGQGPLQPRHLDLSFAHTDGGVFREFVFQVGRDFLGSATS